MKRLFLGDMRTLGLNVAGVQHLGNLNSYQFDAGDGRHQGLARFQSPGAASPVI